MVIRELIKKTAQTLTNSGKENALFDAQQIIRHVFSFTAIQLVQNYETDASEHEKEVTKLALRRASGEPLQYILGTQEFMSLEFFTDKNVLIPRQDTETLVECVLENTKDCTTFLDIGTGTGCIPLSIAFYNKNAKVTGLDISDDAINLSKKNAEKLSLSDRAVFKKLDILSQIPDGKFDVITSNPPYIKTSIIPSLQEEVRDFEPHLALDGGKDGLLFYKRICSIAPQFLNPEGMLFFEIGYDQAEAVAQLMEDNFEEIKVVRDLAGCNRVVTGRLKM